MQLDSQIEMVNPFEMNRERDDMVYINRREFLKRSGTVAIASSLSACGKTRDRPNFLIFLSDDQRYDTIHALGNDHIQTPALDSLVNNGTCFTRAYMMGSLSGATCIPSRAMLLSGRGLFNLQGIGRSIPPEHVTFPETLKKNGYFTFHVGKTHNDKQSFMRMFDDGARIFGWGGYLTDHFRMPVHDFDPSGAYPKEDAYLVGGGADGNLRLPVEKDAEPVGPHSSRLFGDAVIEFLKNYDNQKPFMLYCAFHAPHDTRHAPEEYHQMYPVDKIPLPKNYKPEHPFDNGDLNIRDEKLAPWPRTPEVVKKHLSDYYAIITHMDAQIGRVLDTLQQTGLDQNTIVIFAGDSGLAVGNHGLMGKQNLYDAGGVHVPLIFKGPGIPTGKKRDAMCYLHDVHPTICELAGTPIPESVTAQSLQPVFKNPTAKGRSWLYFAYKNTMRAVQQNRFKLIEYVIDKKRYTQLFDLQHDPDEIYNLVHDPDYEERLQQLRSRLMNCREIDGKAGKAFWDGFDMTSDEQS